MLPRSPAYPSILQRVKDGATFLDVGCFLGQDIRKLVADGAPSSNIWGVDLENFWDLGYDMFRDREKFQAHFIQANLFDTKELKPKLPSGGVDILFICHVLHQFSWERHVEALKCLVDLMRPVSGTQMVGFQIGNNDARVHETYKSASAFLHDADSFKKLWDVVGNETGTKWDVAAKLMKVTECGWDEKGVEYMGNPSVLEFVVTRQ